jgi:phage baseplate assembly protein W
MFDITLGETRDFKFTTCEPDTGAPATLSGTPVISAYVDNSTTQITAGITLSVDFDGVTGLNNVRIVASSGNGYATGTNVALIITTGTVDGVSAVGYKVAEFSIGRAAAFTRLGAPAGASVSADIAAIEAQTDDIGAAGAGLTAIPWNAAWDAEVQSEVADALGVYDPPTNAEMEARTIVAASYATAANLATVAGYLDTEIAAILATTAKLDDTLEDSGGGAYIFTEASLANAPAGGGGGGDATEAKQDTIIALIGTPAGASVSADILAVKTETASILADTDDIGVAGAGLTAIPWNAAWDAEVQSEATDALNAYDPPTRAELTTDTNSVLTAVGDVPTNAELATALGTADDAVLAQIALVKAKTDSLTFTVAGQVDANALSMNDTEILGAGTSGDKWRGA